MSATSKVRWAIAYVVMLVVGLLRFDVEMNTRSCC